MKAVSAIGSKRRADYEESQEPEERKSQRPRIDAKNVLNGCTIEVGPNSTMFSKDFFVDKPFEIGSEGLEGVDWRPKNLSKVTLESSSVPSKNQLRVYMENGWPVTVRGLTGIPAGEDGAIVLRGKQAGKDVSLVINQETDQITYSKQSQRGSAAKIVYTPGEESGEVCVIGKIKEFSARVTHKVVVGDLKGEVGTARVIRELLVDNKLGQRNIENASIALLLNPPRNSDFRTKSSGAPERARALMNSEPQESQGGLLSYDCGSGFNIGKGKIESFVLLDVPVSLSQIVRLPVYCNFKPDGDKFSLEDVSFSKQFSFQTPDVFPAGPVDVIDEGRGIGKTRLSSLLPKGKPLTVMAESGLLEGSVSGDAKLTESTDWNFAARTSNAQEEWLQKRTATYLVAMGIALSNTGRRTPMVALEINMPFGKSADKPTATIGDTKLDVLPTEFGFNVKVLVPPNAIKEVPSVKVDVTFVGSREEQRYAPAVDLVEAEAPAAPRVARSIRRG
jgi:hypothetical protein